MQRRVRNLLECASIRLTGCARTCVTSFFLYRIRAVRKAGSAAEHTQHKLNQAISHVQALPNTENPSSALQGLMICSCQIFPINLVKSQRECTSAGLRQSEGFPVAIALMYHEFFSGMVPTESPLAPLALSAHLAC